MSVGDWGHALQDKVQRCRHAMSAAGHLSYPAAAVSTPSVKGAVGHTAALRRLQFDPHHCRRLVVKLQLQGMADGWCV